MRRVGHPPHAMESGTERRMLRLGCTLIMVSMLVLVACGATASPMTVADAHQMATDRCGASGRELATAYGSGVKLIAAFGATAEQVVRWQEQVVHRDGPRPTSPYRSRAAGEPIVVCYFDGSFTGIAKGAGPAGTAVTSTRAPAYERIIVLVHADGSSALFAAGRMSTLPVTDPTRP